MKLNKEKVNDNIEVNVSRFRRAIDFSSEFTDGEKIVAGVIADHFNPQYGYSYTTHKYLIEVYGFSQSLVSNTIKKLKSGWMTVRRRNRNNVYYLTMQKAESVISERKKAISQYHADKDTYIGMESSLTRGCNRHLHEDVTDSYMGVAPSVQPNVQPQSPNLDSTHASEKRGNLRDSSRSEAPTALTGHGSDDWFVLNSKAPLLTEIQNFIEHMNASFWPEVSDDQTERLRENGHDLDKLQRGAPYAIRKLIKAGHSFHELEDAARRYVSIWEAESKQDWRGNLWPETMTQFFANRFDQYTDQSRTELYYDQDQDEDFQDMELRDQPEQRKQADDYHEPVFDDENRDLDRFGCRISIEGIDGRFTGNESLLALNDNPPSSESVERDADWYDRHELAA